jgi:hypothetical protein
MFASWRTASSIKLVSLSRLGSAQQPSELYFRPRGAGIELDRLVQQGLGLGSIGQTPGCGTERHPELAFEDRTPIARLHQVHEVSEFFFAKQGVGQHRQVIGLIAIAFAGGSCLALSRSGITLLQIHLGKTRTKDRILRRLADRVVQLDFDGLEISFFDILFRWLSFLSAK